MQKAGKPPLYRRWTGAFLGVFFRLLYHQFAWFYDSFAAMVSLGRWKSWVLCASPYVNGPRVLEIGHGPGHLLKDLLDRGIDAVGLDESWQMSALAFKRLQNSGFDPLLVNGYAQLFPFSTGSFDQVVATFPSDYVTHPSTVREISRILTPGGQFVLIPLAWITGYQWPDRLAAWLFRITGQAPKRQHSLETYAHPFIQSLQQSGFQTQVHGIQLESSQVLVVLATKA